MKKNARTTISETKVQNFEMVTIKLHSEYQYDPNYKFIAGKNEWIEFGADNLMPQTLIKYYENSPTHQSLINLKHSMTIGGGLEYDKSNTDLDEFIKRNDLNEVLNRAALDLIIYNGFAFDIGWNDNGTFVAEVGHYDFSTIRVENNPKTKWYYINADWQNWKKNEMVKLPKFSPEDADSQPNQLLYSLSYTPGTYYYPKPDYKCIKFIDFEIQLGEFVLSNINNGMAPSGIFSFKEIPTQEEREIIKQNIKRDFTGAQASGKFIALFAESSEKAVEFIPIQTDNNADIYNALNNLCVQKIISGHHLNNPSVAGLPGVGGISFGNELSTSYEYFYNIVIKAYQYRLLKELSKILIVNGLIENESEIAFKTTQPFQFKFDSNIIGNTITINEIRKSMGFDPIQGGDGIVFKNGTNPAPNDAADNNPNQQLPPTTNQAPSLLKEFNIK